MLLDIFLLNGSYTNDKHTFGGKFFAAECMLILVGFGDNFVVLINLKANSFYLFN